MMRKKWLYILLCLLMQAHAPASEPPPVTIREARYVSSRQVLLKWYRNHTAYRDVSYLVYRNDEKIAEFDDGTSGNSEPGISWSSNFETTSHVYHFVDNNAVVPGNTYEYRVEVRFGDYYQYATTLQIEVPGYPIAMKESRYVSGQQVLLKWYRTHTAYQDARYLVYRNDEKIAEFNDGTSGNNGSGISWISNFETTAHVYHFVDDHAVIPGNTYEYRVEVRFGDYYQAETNLQIEVPEYPITMKESRHVSGQQVLLKWYRNHATYQDARYLVYRNDEKIAEFNDGTSGNNGSGISWMSNFETTAHVYRFIDDRAVVPGNTYDYRVEMRLGDYYQTAVTLQIEIPEYPITILEARQDQGCTSLLKWTDGLHAFPGVVYEIWREGEKLFEFPRESYHGSGNGFYYSIYMGVMTLIIPDTHPGNTYRYEVVAKIMDEYNPKAVAVLEMSGPPAPQLKVIYRYGPYVQLFWPHGEGMYTSKTYELYRDGELLDVIPGQNVGNSGNGNYWYHNSEGMWYDDNGCVPGRNYSYRLVYRPCVESDKYFVASENSIEVPMPPAPEQLAAEKTGYSVYLTWKLADRAGGYPGARQLLYRDGELVCELPISARSFKDEGLDTVGREYSYSLVVVVDRGVRTQAAETVTNGWNFTAPNPWLNYNTETTVQFGVMWGNTCGLPAQLEVFRDGELLPISNINLAFGDIVRPGNLYVYRVRMSLDGGRLYSPWSKAVAVAAPPVGVKAAVISPRESLTNPAWLEGQSTVDDIPVRFSMDGGSEISAVSTSKRSWHLDASVAGQLSGIPLQADRPTVLNMRYGEGNDEETVEESIVWKTLDLAGHDPAMPPLCIRPGDSLLLTVSGQGAAAIDFDGDGNADWQGTADERIPHSFDQPGVYEVAAFLDGVEVGSVIVDVATAEVSDEKLHVNLHEAMVRTISAMPAELDGDIAVSVDSRPEGIRTNTAALGDGRLACRVNSVNWARGKIFVRLHHERGPVLGAFEAGSAEGYLHSNAYFPVIQHLSTGEFLLGATVYVKTINPAIKVRLHVSGENTVFVDSGKSTLDVPLDEFSENGMKNVYIVAPPTVVPEVTQMDLWVEFLAE